MTEPDLKAAETYLSQATGLAQKLKPGTYESVQALALISIALNLQGIAAALASRPAD